MMSIENKKNMYNENIKYILAETSGRSIVNSMIGHILKRVLTIWKIFICNKIYLSYLELVVTVRCSLRCKDCGNLMQYYKKPYDVDMDVLKATIEKIEKSIERIQIVRILGGEPFLYPQLAAILKLLIACENIKIIGIPTNGTVRPSEEVINLLKNNKVRLDISDYGVRDISDFIKMLESENIRYSVSIEKNWEDRGNMLCRNRNDEELDQQMKNCNQICRSVLNGKMFKCPRAAHGDDLEIIKTPEDEYVDFLRDESEFSSKLVDLYYRKRHLKACNYCDMGTDLCHVIPAGIQLDKGL